MYLEALKCREVQDMSEIQWLVIFDATWRSLNLEEVDIKNCITLVEKWLPG